MVFGSDDAVLDELTEAAASFDRRCDPVARGAASSTGIPSKGTTIDTPFAKLLSRKAVPIRTTNRNLRTLEKIVGR